MPLYDYAREDGTLFEALTSSDDNQFAYDEDGAIGRLVWVNAPGVHVPVWHQSAPKEDRHTVRMLRRAADPNDSTRAIEPGMDRDIQRAREEKERKAQLAVERNLMAEMREHDLRIPE